MSILSQLDNKITLFVYGVFNACKIRVEKVIHRLSTGYPHVDKLWISSQISAKVFHRKSTGFRFALVLRIL